MGQLRRVHRCTLLSRSHNRLSAEVRYGTNAWAKDPYIEAGRHNRLSAEVRYGTADTVTEAAEAAGVIIAFRLKSAMGPA